MSVPVAVTRAAVLFGSVTVTAMATLMSPRYHPVAYDGQRT
jgi:hypothetical protein